MSLTEEKFFLWLWVGALFGLAVADALHSFMAVETVAMVLWWLVFELIQRLR